MAASLTVSAIATFTTPAPAAWSLAGGDRKTLTPGRHEALNNHIWRFSRHQLTSAYGLQFRRRGLPGRA